MNFKRIELFGFKSFADKIKIEFNEGITGIVGPNGCGKSNVADSVRWVLGEQSAKVLRGKNMQDVIFNGTEKRKSVSFCEVSLVFDNTPDANGKKLFNLPNNEVTIGRKLYRSNESEYYLNNTLCRLKDIIDLMRDTGAGKEGYSIIGQGKIDEILSSKPDDRRTIFEEAAGILKFKARKVEAERKLARVQENMVRLYDLLTEIKNQMATLERQADKAQKFLEYRDALRELEANMYIYKYDNGANDKRKILDKLNGLNEEIHEIDLRCEVIEKDLLRIKNSIENTDNEIASLNEQQMKILEGQVRISGEKGTATASLESMSREYKRLQDDIVKSNAIVEYKSEQMATDLYAVSQIETRLKDCREEYAKIEDAYLKVIDELQKADDAAKAHEEFMLKTMDEIADIRANLSGLKERREALSEKISDAKFVIDSNKKEIVTLEENRSKLFSDISILKREREGHISVRSEFERKYNENIVKSKQNADEVREAGNRIAALTSNLTFYENLKNSYEGYVSSVKKLMQDAKENSFVKSRVCGVVAELIKVSEKYQTAIEFALGNTLQNIVTNDEDDAKELIGYLKEKQYGRVTFLPMTSVSAETYDGHPALKEKGVQGVACNLINYDSKYKRIMQSVLGRIIVVDTVDNAVFLARKYNYGFKIVTLTGEIFSRSGSITGGYNGKSAVTLLGPETQIENLRKSIEETKLLQNKLVNNGANFEAENAKLEAALKSVSDKCHETEIEEARKQEKLNETEENLKTLNEELIKTSDELKNLQDNFDSIDTKIKLAESLDVGASAQKNTASELKNRQREELEEKRKLRDSLQTKRNELMLSISSMEKETETFNSEIVRLKGECTNITESINEATSRMQILDARMKELNRKLSEMEMSGEDREKIEKIKERLKIISEGKDTNKTEQERLEEERKVITQHRNEAMSKVAAQEASLARVDADIEYLQQRIMEDYNLTYEGAMIYKKEDFEPEEGQRLINRYRRKISELGGEVNVGAIDMLNETKVRYEEFNVQYEDIATSEKSLKEIIAGLTGDMVKLFQENFEKINANFSVIFKELFGGGVGKLILNTDETDDPLEAGIDILAQPPGKKLQHISLLSGGEKALTAIAILFSILKLRPMPFCILDEIEAALDDSNAKLFAEYLHKFSRNTQFIVITHRKPTMELADTLYGVTMEEKGVSKIVSVKLADAVKNYAESKQA